MKQTSVDPMSEFGWDLAPQSAQKVQRSDLARTAPISLDSIPLCNCDPVSGDLSSTWRGIFLQDKIICYKDFENTRSRSDKQKAAIDHLSRGMYNGYLSPKTASKIKKMLTSWIVAVEQYRSIKRNKYDRSLAYITFATVTLAVDQFHTDNEIKRRILTPFIKLLKDQHKIKYYFWRAEAQANGRIHFHLILDRYIHFTDLQHTWNHCQNYLGYYDLYADQTRRENTEKGTQIDPYNPPSTHIKKIPSNKKMIGYVLKYVAKSPKIEEAQEVNGSAWGNGKEFVQYVKNERGDLERRIIRKIAGRIWGCSDELRSIKPYSEELTEQLHADLMLEVERGSARATIEEDFWIFYLDVEQFLKDRAAWFFYSYKQHYDQIFAELYRGGSKEKQEREQYQTQQAA